MKSILEDAKSRAKKPKATEETETAEPLPPLPPDRAMLVTDKFLPIVKR
jgi:hypothetical protein